MSVKILFFGATADIADTHEIEVTLPDAATPAKVVEQISQVYPLLSQHKLVIAVNEEYVDGDLVLTDGDRIAVFTAVSGG